MHDYYKEILGKNTVPVKYSFRYDLENKNFNHKNNHSFRGMLAYLTSLKDEGVLSDEQFQKLLELSCAIYIENKVDELISVKMSEIGSRLFLEKLKKGLNIIGM